MGNTMCECQSEYKELHARNMAAAMAEIAAMSEKKKADYIQRIDRAFARWQMVNM